MLDYIHELEIPYIQHGVMCMVLDGVWQSVPAGISWIVPIGTEHGMTPLRHAMMNYPGFTQINSSDNLHVWMDSAWVECTPKIELDIFIAMCRAK